MTGPVDPYPPEAIYPEQPNAFLFHLCCMGTKNTVGRCRCLGISQPVDLGIRSESACLRQYVRIMDINILN